MERNRECLLPKDDEIKIVEPIPISGLKPTADE